MADGLEIVRNSLDHPRRAIVVDQEGTVRFQAPSYWSDVDIWYVFYIVLGS